ncbi:Uncharacterized protein APZ42_030171 [Daphnia magna]|uniref:RNA-directed DNA polymerase n=1 Tax=Daphnia magna TaxID=35525 RepID=A0A164NZV4_9CRUS|nr:Uncharacterized protein APZ42_030171 [Daphnia magna]
MISCFWVGPGLSWSELLLHVLEALLKFGCLRAVRRMYAYARLVSLDSHCGQYGLLDQHFEGIELFMFQTGLQITSKALYKPIHHPPIPSLDAVLNNPALDGLGLSNLTFDSVIDHSNSSQQQQPHPARRSSRMQPSLRIIVYDQMHGCIVLSRVSLLANTQSGKYYIWRSQRDCKNNNEALEEKFLICASFASCKCSTLLSPSLQATDIGTSSRASGETLPTCPTCGHPPVQKKKKKRSQGNKDRKNKYNREERALKRRDEKEAKKQQADGSIPEEWQPRVVRVLETPFVPSTDCNGSSSSAVVTTSKEWEPRIVRVLEEPSIPLPDLNGNSVSDFKRGRIRQHQTVQPWGTKELKSPEEIEAWKATQSAVAGISSELEQVAVEEGPHLEAEAELDIGGPEYTELVTQPLPVRPDQSAFLYERYIQNAEVEQRIREERNDSCSLRCGCAAGNNCNNQPTIANQQNLIDAIVALTAQMAVQNGAMGGQPDYRRAAKDIPMFSGNPAEDVDDWIADIDRVALVEGWNENIKRRAVISKLGGIAKNWQDLTGNALPHWEDWLERFEATFRPHLTLVEWGVKIEGRRQLPGESGAQYALEKTKLCRLCPHPLKEPEVVFYLICGIQLVEQRSALMSNPPDTIANFIDTIQRLEQLGGPAMDFAGNTTPTSATEKQLLTKILSQLPVHYAIPCRRARDLAVRDGVYSPTRGCYSCNQVGHIARDCPMPPKQNCYRCGKPGHLSHDCNLTPHSGNGPVVGSIGPCEVKGINYRERLPNVTVIMRLQEVEAMGFEIMPLDDKILRMADQSVTRCYGNVRFNVRFKGTEVELRTVYVLWDSVSPLILGADWLIESGVSVQAEDGRLTAHPPLRNEPQHEETDFRVQKQILLDDHFSLHKTVSNMEDEMNRMKEEINKIHTLQSSGVEPERTKLENLPAIPKKKRRIRIKSTQSTETSSDVTSSDCTGNLHGSDEEPGLFSPWPRTNSVPTHEGGTLVVSADRDIPAGTMAYVSVETLTSNQGLIATIAAFSAEPGQEWVVPSCITEVTDGTFQLPIVNVGQRTLKFRKGRKIVCGNSPVTVEELGSTMDECFPYVGVVTQESHPLPNWSINSDLAEEEREQLHNLLLEFRECFYPPENELSSTNLVQHTINVGEALPIHLPPHRMSVRERVVVRELVDDMLERGIIEPSFSPWSSPVVLVRKKTGEVRFCVDYRRLNEVTKKDVYPLPRIDDILDRLGGAKYFSQLDLASGYWQVRMDPAHKERTAFVTADGLYEFNRMPFVLCNAPATFQRLMDRVLADLKWDQCLVYLDDVVVFGSNFAEHQERLRSVLAAIRRSNLSLKTTKCRFAVTEMTILGHVINQEGLHPDPEKQRAIREFPRPVKVSQLRGFLGLASYYRRFIKNFASMAQPLHSLLKKSHVWSQESWTDAAEASFQQLKDMLASTPILVPFRDDWQCELRTDASREGIGAVLLQIKDGKEETVAFISRRLNPAESNYDSNELECLAVVWALQKLRHYVHGRPGELIVVTDNSAVAWMQKKTQVGNKFSRLVAIIAEYGAVFKHRRGTCNQVADALSRNPVGEPEEQGDDGGLFACTVTHKISGKEDIRIRQWEDEELRPILARMVSTEATDNGEQPNSSYEVKDGILYKRVARGKRKLLLVVPRCSRRKFLEDGHAGSTGCHHGLAKTLARIGSRCWWARWIKHVRAYVKKCPYCQLFKRDVGRAVGYLQPIEPTSVPFERWGIDHIGPLTVTQNGNRHILVCVDYATRWVVVQPVPNTSAGLVKDFLLNKIVWFVRNASIQTDRVNAAANTKKKQEKQKRLYDGKRREASSYSVGDLVLVRRNTRKKGKCGKFIAKYVGPLQVVKRLTEVTYRVTNIPGQSTRKRLVIFPAHVSQMKPYLAGYCSRSEDSKVNSIDDESCVSGETTNGESSVSEEVEGTDDSEGDSPEEEREINGRPVIPDESVEPTRWLKWNRNPPRWQRDYVVSNDQEDDSPHVTFLEYISA